jgi:hypothetical protein
MNISRKKNSKINSIVIYLIDIDIFGQSLDSLHHQVI